MEHEASDLMYLIFVVRPYTQRLPRAVRKPPKVYFFDNADVLGDEDARFENLVATHLLKRLHLLEDREGHRYELRYIRDKEGREVDFAVTKDGQLQELIEAKLSDTSVAPSLTHYAQKLQPQRAVQIVGAARHAALRKGSLSVVRAIDEFARV